MNNSETLQIVKIPAERIKIFDDKLVADLRRIGNVSVSVDKDGSVRIMSDNPLAEWKAVDVVRAIGRGFEPSKAKLLFSDEYMLKIIDLKDIFSNEKQRMRQRARIIGTKGKARLKLEELSGASICVYGNTISIIGTLEEVAIAQKGIEMLLSGAPHSTAYFAMQKERRKSTNPIFKSPSVFAEESPKNRRTC